MLNPNRLILTEPLDAFLTMQLCMQIHRLVWTYKMHEMYSSKVISDGQYIVRGQTHTVFGAPDVLLPSFPDDFGQQILCICISVSLLL